MINNKKLASFLFEAATLKRLKRTGWQIYLPTASTIISLLAEYEERKSIEAKIVKDADTLALMLELKQLTERGNNHAREWFEANFDALSLEQSIVLAKEIKNTDSQGWWEKERDKIHKSHKKR